jgi:hypothetical protein
MADLHDWHEAQEVAADALFVLWRNWPRLRAHHDRTPRAYAFHVACQSTSPATAPPVVVCADATRHGCGRATGSRLAAMGRRIVTPPGFGR